ncbi:hypothetical protein BSL78_13382 [Apostichopus japonicus]|uniref:CCHC-type domain-containing protein n=1 Tax=Stichopus japonicus TaxID=307972 RepID=A0A2G8KP68_STIJA|nr:hypothetical protein BSL78_13382 [Apostichopus japonicus]
MSEQVVVRTLGRFGKVTGYEEPEFLECKGVKTGPDELDYNSSPISPLPCGLMGTGPTLHTRASLALVGGVGWKGMRPGCARTSGVAAVYRLGIPAECKGDIVCNSCGKTGHLARLCPDRSYAARVATGVVEAVPSRPFKPYHLMLLSSPQCPTLAPRWSFSTPLRVPPRPWRKLPLRPRLPACPLRRSRTKNGGDGISGVACGAGCRLYWFTGSYARYR